MRESEELVSEVTLLLMTFQWLMARVQLMVSHNNLVCISDLFVTSSMRVICEFAHASVPDSSSLTYSSSLLSLLFVPVGA